MSAAFRMPPFRCLWGFSGIFLSVLVFMASCSCVWSYFIVFGQVFRFHVNQPDSIKFFMDVFRDHFTDPFLLLYLHFIHNVRPCQNGAPCTLFPWCSASSCANRAQVMGLAHTSENRWMAHGNWKPS